MPQRIYSKPLATGLVVLTMLCVLPSTVSTQPDTFTLSLTGQAMIRSDIRVHTPQVVSTWAPLLKADVVFTNFEATIAKPEQSLNEGRLLAPPAALESLKAIGFNLLSLANNHAWDLKAVGIQSTLKEVERLGIAHAGTGNTLQTAAPAYMKRRKARWH